MLQGLEEQIVQNKMKNDILLREQKKEGYNKRMVLKKEKKLLEYQKMDKTLVEKIKKTKINKKLELHKKNYYEIISRYEKEGNFEEDAELFSKSKLYKTKYMENNSEYDISSSDIEKKQDKMYSKLSEKNYIKKEKHMLKEDTNKLSSNFIEREKNNQEKSKDASLADEAKNMIGLFGGPEDDKKQAKKKIIIKSKKDNTVVDASVDKTTVKPSIENKNELESKVDTKEKKEEISIRPVTSNVEVINQQCYNMFEDEIKLHRIMQQSSYYLKYIKV